MRRARHGNVPRIAPDKQTDARAELDDVAERSARMRALRK
jgi:hypothetical protein